ncbi:MAG: hypothetical protein ACD_76C00058G0002 [uncultured bacterium]|nr:MAG: hypothetical protein ACD_76C00058G0002 [uncultured bacterium]HBD05663.1 hypothetical protein [Candidatus Uhrbacteria bacterium]
MRKIKVAFIHNEKKVGTGAHYINDLMSQKLKGLGVEVRHYYPEENLLDDVPTHLKGMRNILFFYSLLSQKDKILKCDIIQGTTYTTLAYLPFNIPVVSHFGSTTKGFLDNVPRSENTKLALRIILMELQAKNVFSELNLRTRRPLRDIASMEGYVARRADYCIATSKKVKSELIKQGVRLKDIGVIHNAIEDYWFAKKPKKFTRNPGLIYLGRIGNDIFTTKLKGIDRLIWLLKKYPKIKKQVYGITSIEKLIKYLKSIPRTNVRSNVRKDRLPSFLRAQAGSILLNTSRYEGFSLSLIEGMSQGLVPVTFPVGVAPEIINGQNGYIVKTHSEAKKRIDYLLKHPERRIAMARNAIETSQNFRAEKMARAIKSIYESILKLKK